MLHNFVDLLNPLRAERLERDVEHMAGVTLNISIEMLSMYRSKRGTSRSRCCKNSLPSKRYSGQNAAHLDRDVHSTCVWRLITERNEFVSRFLIGLLKVG